MSPNKDDHQDDDDGDLDHLNSTGTNVDDHTNDIDIEGSGADGLVRSPATTSTFYTPHGSTTTKLDGDSRRRKKKEKEVFMIRC